jgi:hypothetical protein
MEGEVMIKIITNPANHIETAKIGVKTIDGFAKAGINYVEVKHHEIIPGYQEQYLTLKILPPPPITVKTKRGLFHRKDVGDDLDFYLELVDLSVRDYAPLEGSNVKTRISLVKDALLGMEGHDPS